MLRRVDIYYTECTVDLYGIVYIYIIVTILLLLLYYTMLYYTILYYAILYYTIYYTILYLDAKGAQMCTSRASVCAVCAFPKFEAEQKVIGNQMEPGDHSSTTS